MSVAPHVLSRVEDGIAVVTLNRPEVLNALSSAMLDGFVAAMRAANADPAVEAVVLTGAGARAFSAGQDLEEALAFTPETVATHFRRLGGLYQSVRDLDKPCVVALNGLAAGFGFQVALHGDVRVGHPGVRMSQPEVAAGIPSIVGLWIMREVIGLARAVEMSLTCRMVPAEECVEWGMIDHLVPEAEVMAKAAAVARELAARPKLAFKASKANLRRLTQAGYDETVGAAQRIQAEAFSTGEPQRVMAAFVEARRRRKLGGGP